MERVSLGRETKYYGSRKVGVTWYNLSWGHLSSIIGALLAIFWIILRPVQGHSRARVAFWIRASLRNYVHLTGVFLYTPVSTGSDAAMILALGQKPKRNLTLKVRRSRRISRSTSFGDGNFFHRGSFNSPNACQTTSLKIALRSLLNGL